MSIGNMNNDNGSVLFVNNEGGGFAEEKPIAVGMTIGEFLARWNPDVDVDDCLIRVNGEIVARNQELTDGDRVIVAMNTPLQDGDRVTVSPVNVKGA